MADTEQLVVQLEARIRDFERNFQKASRVANDNFGKIENRGRSAARQMESTFLSTAKSINGSLSNLGAGVFGNLKGQLAGLGGAVVGALGLNELKGYADGWQQAANKIAAAGEASNRVTLRQNELADIAIRSRADLGATVDLYTGLRRATEEMGASQAQVLKVTETVNKAFTVGGQSASTAAGAILQLNQAFASGVLRGDELNSVLEGAPPLARLIAKEFGVSVGQLKSLGEEGKLTADRVFGAILKGSSAVEAEFAKTAPTIGQSFANLSTAMMRYVGETDQAYGVSARLAQGLNGMALNIDTVAAGAAVLGAALAGVFVGGPIGAGIAAAGTAVALFGDQVRPIAGDLATLGDYGRIAFELIKTTGGEAAAQFSAAFQSAADTVTAILSGTGVSVSDMLGAIKSALNSVISAFVIAGEAIQSAWNGLGASLTGVIVGAMNGVVAAIEAALNKIVSGVNSVLSTVNGMGAKVGVDLGLGQLNSVNLGRVESAYKSAGETAGKAFQSGSRDYVGDALSSAGDALQRFRDKANANARDRVDNQAEIDRRNQQRLADHTRNNGSLTAPLKPVTPKNAGGGGGGGKGGSDSENDFQKAVAATEANIARLDREREAIGRSAAEAARAEMAFKLLDAAKQAGMPITDALRGKVDQLADAYANAKTSLEAAKQQQEQMKSLAQFAGQSISGFFSDIVSGGKNAKDALMNLVKKLADVALQAALLGQGPLAGLFGTAAPAGATGVGGLIGGFMKLFGFAEGGFTGAGGKHDPAGIVHAGEYVFSQDAVRRIGVGNLEAMHQGRRLPGFAQGGFVGAPPVLPSAKKAVGAGNASISQNVTVNVAGGSSGDRKADADYAEMIGASVQREMRAMVGAEIRQQMRPGGIIRASHR